MAFKSLLNQPEIWCNVLSETYLKSDTSHDDVNWDIRGYTLIIADNPSDIKRGGPYYKHSLAFRLLHINYFNTCINFEISFGGRICNFIS